jgi:hypothetical protein
MAEPNSILTFSDLIIEVAYMLGIAYYGSDGTQAAQVPVDAHDLDLCKRIVNDAIRMFVADQPENGWRWTRQLLSVDLWQDLTDNTANKITSATYNAGTNLTTLTVATASFYPSMELKTISFTSGAASFSISGYISTTSITVTGNASAYNNTTFAIASGGNFTLPLTFGGQYTGEPAFAPGTNRGTHMQWCDESKIRVLRENSNDSSGIPYLMAVQRMSTGTPRNRWEAMFYRTPGTYLSVQFPYLVMFDKLSAVTDVSPAPFSFDEAIKAACKAQAEKDVQDTMGKEWNYYRTIALPNAYKIDAQAAPRTLGRMRGSQLGWITPTEFRDLHPRPTVDLS